MKAKYAVKRLMDIVMALVGLVLLSPLLILLAILIFLTMGRPVLFMQPRPGLNTRPFHIYKFRSMKLVRDPANPQSDQRRMTRVGSFMRDFSLDELPQLINVLKGDMSIVGPRPLLFEYIPFYKPEEMRRHEMRPGITGLAQINGRNNLDWDKRLAMDVDYVDRWSVWLDIAIILKTVWVVIKRDSVRTDGHATFLRLDEYRKR